MTHPPTTLLTDIGLSIVFATAAAHLARLLKQPLILGYVLGGVLLGSHLGFGLVTDQASVELISEIGLILLLFIIGLEINLRELARMGKTMFVLGFAQFAACVLLGMAFFRSLGYTLGAGNFDLLYIGVALALSSTLIVVKLLHDKFEIHTVPGRLTVGVLVLQDIWAIAFMAVQPNLLDPRLSGILRSVLQGGLLLLCAFVVSRHLLARLFHRVAKAPELVLLSSISWCFVLCGLAQRAGLSKEMGALIAGMSIAAFPYGTDVIAKLAGVRDFFVTLFFVSLGLKVPRPALADLGMAGVAVGFVAFSRLLSVAPVSHLLGAGLRNGLLTALNLSQISEFSLVIVALGMQHGHVGEDLQARILTAMLLASVFSTYLILFNDRLARVALRGLSKLGIRESGQGSAQRSKPPEEPRDIVLLGCFREGQALLKAIAEGASDLTERVLVVDYNPAFRHQVERLGFKWVYGDLAHPETLHHLGIEAASTVICSVSDTYLKGTTNNRLLSHLKRLAPHARLVMTAEEPGDAQKLLHSGAAQVVVPGQLAGARMFSILRESPQS